MCGISGIFYRNGDEVGQTIINKMNNTLIHRGPDHGGTRLFGDVALAHRRLSIIDLSSEANQPMSSSDDRYTIVFNGEVYNFKDIRAQLNGNGVEFYTTSDTEVVLKSFIFWGSTHFQVSTACLRWQFMIR